jgi:predicted glycoside hydrolase/deacetylase ChbG (UPF0249 family)
MKRTLIVILLFTVISSLSGQNKNDLLIRCDDMGMSHAVNSAFLELAKTGIPFSASVMFVCPWYLEAVQILKENPQISVGIHLTLNAEWENYRWGPVTGREAVPSLVDSKGYFFPSRAALNANNPDLAEMEKELRAQIERALDTGLKIDYVDHHMGAAVDKPEYRAILEKLAAEYKLGISRYFNEIYAKNMYSDPIEEKADSLFKILTEYLIEGRPNLLVCHIGKDHPELQAMYDLNPFGLKFMSKHRQAELDALTSERIQNLLKSENIRLITYRDLIKAQGLENMKRPLD